MGSFLSSLCAPASLYIECFRNDLLIEINRTMQYSLFYCIRHLLCILFFSTALCCDKPLPPHLTPPRVCNLLGVICTVNWYWCSFQVLEWLHPFLSRRCWDVILILPLQNQRVFFFFFSSTKLRKQTDWSWKHFLLSQNQGDLKHILSAFLKFQTNGMRCLYKRYGYIY